jgi:hypothetical protein
MRLVKAEILKLVRRRGTMLWCLLLTIGSVVVTEVILLILHAANATKHGPAGGTTNLDHLVLLGAAAGTQDVSAGVFRDLVVTRRSRKALFNVRYPGALIVFLPMLAAAFGIALARSYAFASGLATPSAATVGHYATYLAGVSAVNIAVALGLAAFASSRVVVGVLVAWVAIVAPLLQSITSLGSARQLSYVAAAVSLLPDTADVGNRVPMSTSTAVAVLIGWAAVCLLAGRWRAERMSA